jgi:Predicted dioxygenase of extradiol dioxygenase family
VEPILHLSFPVRDVERSIAFYVDVLGCDLGRVRDEFADVWFFGMQITLHAQPEQVLSPDLRGVRHFGVTLDLDDLHAVLQRLETHRVAWLSELATEYPGTPKEQTKAKVLDPDGNAIELKSYADPASALGHVGRSDRTSR